MAWHKLWRNLGATENQIQCLILLDVEARIHEEAEEIEVWSPSYPRSLQTVYIGNNEQSVGQTTQNQLQRFSVALNELRGRGRECEQFKAMRPP